MTGETSIVTKRKGEAQASPFFRCTRRTPIAAPCRDHRNPISICSTQIYLPAAHWVYAGHGRRYRPAAGEESWFVTQKCRGALKRFQAEKPRLDHPFIERAIGRHGVGNAFEWADALAFVTNEGRIGEAGVSRSTPTAPCATYGDASCARLAASSGEYEDVPSGLRQLLLGTAE